MTTPELVNAIQGNLVRIDALVAFVAACNRRDTLFITEKWFAPRRKKLLSLLTDPITEDEALVLREVLWQRIRFNTLFDWLAEKPVSWAEYQEVKRAEAEARRWRTMAEGIFPWDEVEASRADSELQRVAPVEYPGPAFLQVRPFERPAHLESKTCPSCHAPLTWIYFRSPGWTWEKLCGRAGWLGVCHSCHLQVDFSLVVMN
jgi:hypothetical protein